MNRSSYPSWIPIVASLLVAACGSKEPDRGPPPRAAEPAQTQTPAPPPADEAAPKKVAGPSAPDPQLLVGDDQVAEDADLDGMAVLGDHVYWVSYNSSAGKSALLRSPVGGGAPETVIGDGRFRDLVAHDGHVYWHDFQKVYRLAPGGQPETVLEGRACDLVVDDGVVVVADDRITRLGAGAPVVREVEGLDACNGLVGVDGDAIYWVGVPGKRRGEGTPSVYRLEEGGWKPVISEPFASGQIASAFFHDGTAVLVGTALTAEGGVVRQPLAGGEATRHLAGVAFGKAALDADGTLFALAQVRGAGGGDAYLVHRFSPDGRHAIVARPGGEHSMRRVVLAGDHVYWHDFDRMYRAPKGDGAGLVAVDARPIGGLPPVDPTLARYGCDALITAADVAELCGLDGTLAVDEREGRYTAFACARSVRKQGKRDKVLVTVQATSQAGARAMVGLSLDSDEPVAAGEVRKEVAIGDRGAFTRSAFVNDLWQTASAAKGDAYVTVRAIRSGGGQPLCPDDAVIELGKRVVSRLK